MTAGPAAAGLPGLLIPLTLLRTPLLRPDRR